MEWNFKDLNQDYSFNFYWKPVVSIETLDCRYFFKAKENIFLLPARNGYNIIGYKYIE